jgi:hypothetical protein
MVDEIFNMNKTHLKTVVLPALAATYKLIWHAFAKASPSAGSLVWRRGPQNLSVTITDLQSRTNKLQIVTRRSAAPPSYETRRTLHADHSGMTKFSSKDDSHYRMVLAEVEAMIKAFKSRKQASAGENHPTTENDSLKHHGNNTHGAVVLYSTSSFGDSGRVGKYIASPYTSYI